MSSKDNAEIPLTTNDDALEIWMTKSVHVNNSAMCAWTRIYDNEK